jgi:hypothetical protein
VTGATLPSVPKAFDGFISNAPVEGGPTRHAAYSETIGTKSAQLHWISSLLLWLCSEEKSWQLGLAGG